MSQKTRAQLKAYLETNDVPTQAQYVDLVDSVPNFVDDSYTLPTFAVGTTTTLAAGEDATVVNSGSGSAAVLDFGIPAGYDGATIYSTVGVPNVSVGVDGDWAFDTSVNAYVYYKSSGAWAMVNSLRGPAGADGVDGACIASVSFVGDDMVFVLDDASTVSIIGAKTTLTGPSGANGTNGTNGTSYIWKGTYDAGTSYSANDCVAYNGTSYIYINVTPGSGHTPADDAYWDILALKGTDGTGTGDVMGPATNADSYIPQWDGVNSKTLKAGIPTTTFASALGADDNYVTDAEKTSIGTIGDKAPSANPTFTGTVILPKTLEIQDTSADHQYVLAVNELTADRTVTLPLLTGNDEFTFKAHTQTLTNKRINPRLVTATSYTTDTGTSLDVSTCDQFEVTAQAGALKLNNPSGTPTGGQRLTVRIKDNGTARALTYDTQFRAMGVALPSTTVLSKTLYLGFIFNATDTKWDLVAVAQEA
ncbi:hypothetical protein HGB13_00600 [bacterium]|nr:hypothetical protein [bacterium]